MKSDLDWIIQHYKISTKVVNIWKMTFILMKYNFNLLVMPYLKSTDTCSGL